MTLDPQTMLSGLIFGCIGFAYFRHGKKLSKPLHVASGLGLMILPYFIESLVPQIATCSVLAALPFAAHWL